MICFTSAARCKRFCSVGFLFNYVKTPIRYCILAKAALIAARASEAVRRGLGVGGGGQAMLTERFLTAGSKQAEEEGSPLGGRRLFTATQTWHWRAWLHWVWRGDSSAGCQSPGCSHFRFLHSGFLPSELRDVPLFSRGPLPRDLSVSLHADCWPVPAGQTPTPPTASAEVHRPPVWSDYVEGSRRDGISTGKQLVMFQL